MKARSSILKWGLWVGWTIVPSLGLLMGFRLTLSMVTMLDLAIALSKRIVVKRSVTASQEPFRAGSAA